MKNFSQILGIIFYGSLILAPQHLLSQTSDRRQGGAPPPTQANSGASNGGGGNSNPQAGNKFLDRFESENTTKVKFNEILKNRPRLLAQFKLLEESAVGITAIMIESPAVKKRWLFTKHKSMTLEDPACVNASVYYSQKRIVGCQNDEFVHVDDTWFSRRPIPGSKNETAEEIELDRVWFLNHELLVGFMLARNDFVKYPASRMVIETKLRALNASMMSVDKTRKLDKWDEDSQADLRTIVNAFVQNRSEYEEIKASIPLLFVGYCQAYSEYQIAQAEFYGREAQKYEYLLESERLNVEIEKSGLPDLDKAAKRLEIRVLRGPEERRLRDETYEPEKIFRASIVKLRNATQKISSRIPVDRIDTYDYGMLSGTRITLNKELSDGANKIVQHARRFRGADVSYNEISRYVNDMIIQGKLDSDLEFPYTILKGSDYGCR